MRQDLEEAIKEDIHDQEDDLIDFQINKIKSLGVPFKKGTRGVTAPQLDGTNREVHESWLREWVQNGFSNYPIVSRSQGVDILQNIAKGLPAFVVGIGPSLQDAIKSLKLAQQRSIIIATDASLKILLRHGITPHIVISLDCKKGQNSLWSTVSTSNLVCAFHSCTHPDNISSWKGKRLFFNIYQNDGDWHQVILPIVYGHLGKIHACGTVGNAGILMASGMGCDPIMGVGMDFCYRQIDGKYRYRCDDFKLVDGEWVIEEKPLLYDNDDRMSHTFDVELKGQKFKVDKPLEFYRNSLLDNVGNSFINFINCSPGGALDPFIKPVTVMEAIEKHCQRPIMRMESCLFHLNKILDDPIKRDHWV